MVPIEKFLTHKRAYDLRHGIPASKRSYGHWTSNFVLNWDYSLVLLKNKVDYTDFISPVCLPAKENQDYSMKTSYASGWGNTAYMKDEIMGLYSAKPSDVPKTVKLEVIQSHSCERYTQKCERCPPQLCEMCEETTTVCTYAFRQLNQTLVEDACQGDSGGRGF